MTMIRSLSSLSERRVTLIGSVLISVILLSFYLTTAAANSSIGNGVAFIGRNNRIIHNQQQLLLIENIRGGAKVATMDDDEEESEDEDYEEEEESEDEEEDDIDLSAGLASSLKSAREKSKAKKSTATKKVISTKMSTTKKKKSNKKAILEILHVPYIIRACLNPLVLSAMIKSYFASLFNINYLDTIVTKGDSSSNLRSALEEKARKKPPSSFTSNKKGKRSMKPGQAKTLSDLPQLPQ